ncbi:MAG: histidine phosphatase family protein [Kosmotogaceae bacterium]|nr:histidine phosphatase family protein [Kosmotogaceae bacterium]
MNIHFVRHGETEWNNSNRWQGRSDIPLSEKGRKQAEITGIYLKEHIPSVAAIYSSDLKRAKETAGIIAISYAEIPVANPVLREADVGLWNGLEISEAFKCYGNLIEHWRKDPWADIPGTEPLGEVQRRAAGFIKHLSANFQGKHVIVVSHALLIRTAICYATGLPLENHYRLSLHNCSISTIKIEGAEMRLLEVNLWRHLEEN